MPELQEANGEPIQLLIYAELICMIWFTIEYMARFVVNPNKVSESKNKMKIAGGNCERSIQNIYVTLAWRPIFPHFLWKMQRMQLETWW